MAMALMAHDECGVFDIECCTVVIVLVLQVDNASKGFRLVQKGNCAERVAGISKHIVVMLLSTCV